MYSQGDDYEARRRIEHVKAQLDSVTAMLCALCRRISEGGPLPPEIAAWYEQHKAWDKSQGR